MTCWKGGFFETKEAAFDHVIAEEERSLRSSERRLNELRKAKERHCT